MITRNQQVALAIGCGALLLLGVAPTATGAIRNGSNGPLHKVRDVRLPGNPTRFDYQAVDTDRRLLYVAHLGDSSLDVLDLDTLTVDAVVPGIAQVHGVAIAPELGTVYASATGTDTLVTIDATTNRVTDRTPTGAFPDGVAFDTQRKVVFVSNKDDGTITRIESLTGKRDPSVALGHEVGNVAVDEADQLVYAAVRPPDRLVAIDASSGAISTRIHLSGCDGAHGLYLDLVHQRAFVACESNRTLMVVDLTRRKVTQRADVGIAPDVLAYDAALERLYVASESGTVTTFDTDGQHIATLGEQRVGATAHSVSVDPATHRVFFPLEDVRGHPVLRVMQPKT